MHRSITFLTRRRSNTRTTTKNIQNITDDIEEQM
jgi:hypothetical protein